MFHFAQIKTNDIFSFANCKRLYFIIKQKKEFITNQNIEMPVEYEYIADLCINFDCT